MVEFAAYTGLRASELAGLEVADLVFAPVPVGAQPKCSVRVERTKVKSKRAGEGWIVGTPKSKRSRRTVPLPGWLAAKMADYLAHDHPRATEPDAPLWPGRAESGGPSRPTGRRVAHGAGLVSAGRAGHVLPVRVRPCAAGGGVAGDDAPAPRRHMPAYCKACGCTTCATAQPWRGCKPVCRWCRCRDGSVTRSRRSRSMCTAIGFRKRSKIRCRSRWREMSLSRMRHRDSG